MMKKIFSFVIIFIVFLSFTNTINAMNNIRIYTENGIKPGTNTSSNSLVIFVVLDGEEIIGFFTFSDHNFENLETNDEILDAFKGIVNFYAGIDILTITANEMATYIFPAQQWQNGISKIEFTTNSFKAYMPESYSGGLIIEDYKNYKLYTNVCDAKDFLKRKKELTSALTDNTNVKNIILDKFKEPHLNSVFSKNYDKAVEFSNECEQFLDVFTTENFQKYWKKYTTALLGNDSDVSGLLNTKTCTKDDLKIVNEIMNALSKEREYLFSTNDPIANTWLERTKEEYLKLVDEQEKFITMRSSYNEKILKDPNYSDKNVCTNTAEVRKFLNAAAESEVKEDGKSDLDSLIISEEEIQNNKEELITLEEEIQAGIKISNKEWTGCKSLSQDILSLIKYGLWTMAILGILLLVILTVVDVIPVLVGDVDRTQKKMFEKFKKRLIALVLLILAPLITNLIINLVLNDVLNLGIDFCEIPK